MFKELAPYLRQRAVLLTVTHLEEDQIRVNVVPAEAQGRRECCTHHAADRDGNSRGTRPGSAGDSGQLCGGASRTQEHPGPSESRDGRRSEGCAGGSPLQEQDATYKGRAEARTGKSFRERQTCSADIFGISKSCRPLRLT